MRKLFFDELYLRMFFNPKIILITADMGYFFLDKIRDNIPTQFFNVGSSEQLMLGAAVGMAMEGYIPLVYSITPFVLYRPYELIRNYLNYESIPVKIIGGGRGKDYDNLGFSHWAEEDKKCLEPFDNIIKLWPKSDTDISVLVDFVITSKEPIYINLTR